MTPPVEAARIDELTVDWRHARAADLDARAARARSRGRDPSWWSARARSLRAGWADRIGRCGELDEGSIVWCVACGCTHPVMVRCGRHAQCRPCGRRRWGHIRARVVRGLGPACRAAGSARAAPLRCGDPACGCRSLPPVVRVALRVWTFSARPAATPAATFEALTLGWARWRAWLASRGVAPAAYVRVVEAHDSGHPHVHVIALAPPICYRLMRAAWIRHVDGDPDAQGVHDSLGGRRMSPSKAARYVASYVSKGGELGGERLAAWLTATYGRRIYTASRRLLPPRDRAPCPDCGERALGRSSLMLVHRRTTVSPGNPTEKPRPPPD